jgi:hypothetical protein
MGKTGAVRKLVSALFLADFPCSSNIMRTLYQPTGAGLFGHVPRNDKYIGISKAPIYPGRLSGLSGLTFLHGTPHVLNGPVIACFDHAHP